MLLQDSTASYIYGPGGLLVEQVQGSTPYYYHPDQLGSIRALTDGSGTVQNTYQYDAYGTTTSSTTNVYNPFRYAGEYLDSESGLYYLRARYYDPATQQFLTRDPLAALTGTPYAYTEGSPLNGTDPGGLAASVGPDTGAWTGTSLPCGLARFLCSKAELDAIRYSEHQREEREKNLAAEQANDPTKAAQILDSLNWACSLGDVGACQALGQILGNAICSALPPGGLPQGALDTLNYADANGGAAQPGYYGNQPFRNDGRKGGQILPRFDANGNPITYREYDVHPFVSNALRGQERVVIGSDGHAYYTNNHYTTFTLIR